MELRRPIPTGANSAVENELQHEAAMRVQARLDAEEALRKRVARAKSIRTALSVIVMLGALGVVVWAWRSGLLDSALDHRPAAGKGPEAAPASEDMPRVAAPRVVEEAPVVPAEPVAEPVAKPSVPAKKPAASPAHAAALAKFAGASFDYWKNAVPEDKPGKDGVRAYTGLVPDGAGGFTLLEIEMGGGRPFSATRLSASGAEPIDKAAFNGLIARTPYLVVREGRCYFCSAGQAEKPVAIKVPPKGGAFNPSVAEFGALVDCMAQAGVKAPATRYGVSLVLEKLKREIPVATVGYGDEIPRATFEQAVRRLVDDADTCETMLAAGKVVVKAVK